MRVLFDPIKISYQNLNGAKFRSFLTMLGIIIGVASVIVVMSIGGSAQKLILSQIKGIGSNLIGILPGASEEEGPPAMALGITITTLKYKDYEALLDSRKAPDIVDAAAYVTGTALVKSPSETRQVNYQGVTASLINVENVSVEQGRFFIKQEDTNLARVAVLGSATAKDLFPNVDPVGKNIVIKDQSFTVVGVLEKRGSSGFSNTDEEMFVPLYTAQKILLGIDHLTFIRAKVANEANVERTIADVKSTLREQHNIKDSADDDFSVRSTAQALEILTTITNVLKYFLTSIAAISLLVGGVGIMNIMLVSVKQRIWEIGLRQAVGAKKRDIVLQFLIESIFITFSGGIAGITLGGSVAFLSSLVIQKLGYEWEFSLPIQSILFATGIAILIGLIFGMYPASKAGRVSPMEALRYE
ncbi:MAG: FtsX-like permease family protein [Candidatus Moranbacteria bacterium]|nr:FtsX-like permease family protein [Candidatus Moranbacteria bacterium]